MGHICPLHASTYLNPNLHGQNCLLSALIAGGLVWSLNPCLLQANGSWRSQPGHRQSVLCCKINLLLLSSAKIHFLKQHNSPSETPSAHLSACPQSCLRQLYTEPSMAAQVCPKAEFKFPLLVNRPFSFYSSTTSSVVSTIISHHLGSRSGFLHSCRVCMINAGSDTPSLGTRPQLESCCLFSSLYSL